MECASELLYGVDDDRRVREALAALLCANGRNVHAFNSGREFLDASCHDVFACLMLDMRMPGMSGLEVQKLVSRGSQIPVIIIAGRGDVPSTVLAMKGGAVAFLTKSLDEDALMHAVDTALARAHVLRKVAEDAAALHALYQSLTPREQDEKQAAAVPDITEYTVQVHRGHIMRKMQADSFATLVRQANCSSKHRRRQPSMHDTNANSLLGPMTRRKKCPRHEFERLP